MRLARFWVLGCLVVLPAGCGPKFVSVSGTVTYQGKALSGGTVTFYDSTNKPRSSPIDANGGYALKDVATGKARIAVFAPMDIPFDSTGTGLKGGGVAPKPAAATAVTLPAKYNDPDKSGLTCDVKTIDQKHEVKLD